MTLTLRNKIVRTCAVPLAAVMFMTTSGLGSAHAGIVATDEAAHQQAVAADRDSLLEALERDDVRNQLVALGVAPEEAAARINAMSDAEISQAMADVNGMPAGEGAVGAVVGALLIVFIILLVTDIVGETDVFDFDD